MDDDATTGHGIADLTERLRFAPAEGRIWLDDQRAILLRSPVFGALRQELIKVLGADAARSLFSRLGYEEGSRDMELASAIRRGESPRDTFAAGPQIHALTGFGAATQEALTFDIARGEFHAIYDVADSVEAAAHLQGGDPSSEPVCWMQSGYASGYASAFLGRPVLFREVSCRAMGHASCRIVGKPLETWQQEDTATRYFRPQEFVNRFADAETAPPDDPDAPPVVGISSGFAATMHLVTRAAKAQATVLFLGETGVGKEVFARALHSLSPRKERPFVAVNCSALPEQLVEAELFGVEKGAYTGAIEARAGRFERADGGTLFLDEITNLSRTSQGKLLRALQEREIERVGGTQSRRVNVRVIAATNLDLKGEVQAGRFREDLYYRLTTFPVRIPPLRDRRDDIPLLMQHFLHRYTRLHGAAVSGFTPRAVEALLHYDYPGNIRELENMIERGVLLADGGQATPGGATEAAIDIGHLFADGTPLQDPTLALNPLGHLIDSTALQTGSQVPASDNRHLVRQLLDRLATEPAEDTNGATTPLARLEQIAISEAVAQCHGNLAAAARKLGLTRRQLAYRYAKLAGR